MKKTILVLAALSLGSAAFAQKLVIKGSDTLGAKLVPTLAEEYKARNAGVSFEIAAEGSTTGIAAIIDGTDQIGMSSRRARPTEVSAATAKGGQFSSATGAITDTYWRATWTVSGTSPSFQTRIIIGIY